MKYKVIETEVFFPDYKYEEEYTTLAEAQDRLKEIYHENVIEQDPDLIYKADYTDNAAYVEFNDTNKVYWDIEESD